MKVMRTGWRDAALALSASLVVVFVVFACASALGKRPGRGEGLSDAAVREAVGDALRLDPGVSGHPVAAAVQDGIVTLTGSVDNILAKERAALVAETVRGVRAVVNRVEVQPRAGLSDAEIRSDVARALAEDPATDAYEVEAKVESGVVELTGTVDSWAEHQLCATVAKGVAGVVELQNRIVVRPKARRADGEIRNEIEERMRWNALLDAGLVAVRVEDGRVALSGTVGSAAEKRQAREDAWVDGVASVDDSGLAVARWARDEDLRRGGPADKSDEAIRRAVRDALMVDPRVRFFDVRPEVSRGVAALYGVVDNLKARQAAAQDAANTVGVVRVRNMIEVRPQAGLTDDEISARARGALGRDPVLGPYGIDVKIEDGRAELRGEVESAFQRGRAEEVVSRVKGVSRVENRLKVEGDARLLYDPYLYDPYPYDFRWYGESLERYTNKSDARLEKDIRNRLRWSPYVNEGDVAVTVENGRARLTGTVGSWREYSIASNKAFEAGAVAVDNDLVVILGRKASR